MASIVVVYFEFDKTIETISTAKVKLEEPEIGIECDVPWETEDIAEDGKTVIRSENYRGKIIWFSEGMCSINKPWHYIATMFAFNMSKCAHMND
jgi:hypothetical protein